MDYLQETLPAEIITIILSYLDYGAKVYMRATNSFYRQQIQMSHFNFYFTRASVLPEMIDHMAKYYGDHDIGIHFKKSIDRELNPYAEHLWKLSNLTALSFDFLPQVMNYRTPQEHINKLQRLSKLVEFPHNPFTAQGDFLNLRTIELMRFSNDELTRMTNIEKLKNDESKYVVRHEGISFPFLANPDRVTSISLRKENIDLKALTRFTNLKSLKYGDTTYNEGNYILRNLATSIQKLAISGKHYYDYYNLTNVTSLKVDMITEHFPSITTLHNLKKLDVGLVTWTNADREALDLAPLTSLESLIWRNLVFRQVFATIQSPHLTYLEIQACDGMDLGQLVSLQNSLEELLLKETITSAESVDYSPVSQLTGLVSLRISGNNESLTNIETLTNLTRLEVKYIYKPEEDKGRDWSLSKLTNLERLALPSARAEFLNDIVPLTSKLTYLEVKLTSEHLARNTTCLGTMTNLQALHLHTALNDFLFWQDLPKLTKLHALSLWKIDSEEKLISLSTLTNLTTLNVFRSKTLRGDELTRLTSLQTLTFVSKVAKATIGKPKAFKKFSAKMPRLYQCTFK